MNFLITFILFSAFFTLMAIGYIFAKKVLQKGCSMSPDECLCRKEGKDPAQCDIEPLEKT